MHWCLEAAKNITWLGHNCLVTEVPDKKNLLLIRVQYAEEVK